MKLYLWLIKQNNLNAYGRVELHFHAFCNSILHAGVQYHPHYGYFTPDKTVPCTHWIEGLNVAVKKKILALAKNCNPGRRQVRSLGTIN